MGEAKRKKNREAQKKTELFQKTEAVIFYLLLFLFLTNRLIGVLNLIGEAAVWEVKIHFILKNVLIWGCALYAAFRLLIYNRKWLVWLVCVAGMTVLFFIRKRLLGWDNIRDVYLCLLFIPLAYGRNLSKILKLYLGMSVTILLLGFAGLPFGITKSVGKLISNAGTSFGLVYPNHWGRLFFIAFVAVWYLWLQDRPFVTLAICWISAIPMRTVIRCTTVALMLIAFPAFGIVKWCLKKRKKKEAGTGSGTMVRAVHLFVMILPVLCLGITAGLGLVREKLFLLTYRTAFSSLAMRFITAGILFENYPLKLFGFHLDAQTPIVEFYEGYKYDASPVDNGYVYFVFAYGIIWMLLCLFWFAFVGHKCMRNKDFAMVWIYIFMIGYGLIEKVPFQLEHNFLCFYPMMIGNISYFREYLDFWQASKKKKES